ncbi:hypothetical protein EIP86_005724 [Pleurotus ostreatoroseus]|nr:hypothetical protein EIP86_005724 [Pleurotus ostreatoroseus]
MWILERHADSLPDLQVDHGHTDGIAADIFSKYEHPSNTIICEEDKLCRTDQNDLVIFHSVDAQTLDDATLITVRNILSVRPPPGEKVLQLVVSTIRNRLAIQSVETYKMGTDHNPNPVLSFLTASARITFVDILADALRTELNNTSVDQWYLEPVGREWMDDAAVLIIALVPHNTPIPRSATSLFLRMVQPDTGAGINYRGCALISDRIVVQVAGNRTSWQWQSTVFACLVDALKSCDLAIFRDIVHWSYIDDADVDLQSNTYKRLLDGIRDNSYAVQRETLAVLFQVAIAIQYNYVMTGDATDKNLITETHPSDSRQLTNFILDSYPLIEDLVPRSRSSKSRIHGSVGIDQFFAAYFSVPNQLPVFLDHMWARPELTSTQRVRDLLQSPLNEAWKLDRPSLEIQISVLSVCAQFFSSCRQRNLDNPSNIQSILGLYLVVATYPAQRDEQTITLWRRICDDTLQCVEHVERLNPAVTRAAEAAPVAYAILGLIDQDSEDQNWVYRVGRADVRATTQFTDRHRSDENNRYAQWRKEFDSNTSFYTEKFVRKLSEISDLHEDPLGRRFWRVRLLEDCEKEGLRAT